MALCSPIPTQKKKGESKLARVHLQQAKDVTRSIATLVLILGTRWRWVVHFTPRPLYPGERTSAPRWIGDWWGPIPALDGFKRREKSLVSIAIRTLVRQFRCKTVYRLSNTVCSIYTKKWKGRFEVQEEGNLHSHRISYLANKNILQANEGEANEGEGRTAVLPSPS